MTAKRRYIAGLVGFLVSWSALIIGAPAADDPLNAFPTAERPVENRVQRLTEAELSLIELPKDGEQVVLSIALERRDPKKEAIEAAPWLKVYADGRIDCESELEPKAGRATDKLTKPELQWLLHLAINECRLLAQSTDEIEAKLEAQGANKQSRPKSVNLPEPADFADQYHYHVNLPAGRNDLLLPKRALILRPLRARLELGAFASLNKYARFLVARAYLCNNQERQVILDDVNHQLKAKDANLPAFRLEHLARTGRLKGIDFFVEFQHEVELGNNQYQKIVAVLIQKNKEAEPVVTITTTKYMKQRNIVRP